MIFELSFQNVLTETTIFFKKKVGKSHYNFYLSQNCSKMVHIWYTNQSDQLSLLFVLI